VNPKGAKIAGGASSGTSWRFSEVDLGIVTIPAAHVPL
jgi:hypothetical protein